MDADIETKYHSAGFRRRRLRPIRSAPKDIVPVPHVAYESLRFENAEHIESILAVPDGKVATIAAAGTSSIIALAGGARELDSIDLSSEQIAFNYALQHVMSSLGAKDFLHQLNIFNQSRRSVKEVPDEIRQRLLASLPEFLARTNVPSHLQESIKHFVLYEEFDLEDDLAAIKDWHTEEHIRNIIDAISQGRWRLHQDDLLHYFMNTPQAEYDAIYTSNVYDHLTQGTDPAKKNAEQVEKDLEVALSRALKPRGKVGLYNLYRQYDKEAAWQKRELTQPVWDSAWSVKKSPHILNGFTNGDWYTLTKKEPTPIPSGH